MGIPDRQKASLLSLAAPDGHHSFAASIHSEFKGLFHSLRIQHVCGVGIHSKFFLSIGNPERLPFQSLYPITAMQHRPILVKQGIASFAG